MQGRENRNPQAVGPQETGNPRGGQSGRTSGRAFAWHTDSSPGSVSSILRGSLSTARRDSLTTSGCGLKTGEGMVKYPMVSWEEKGYLGKLRHYRL